MICILSYPQSVSEEGAGRGRHEVSHAAPDRWNVREGHSETQTNAAESPEAIVSGLFTL